MPRSSRVRSQSLQQSPPPSFWAEARAACDAHATFVIFDKIPTGLGKTGRLFASEHTGVAPDVLALGKALGGGILPLAAVIARSGLDVGADLAAVDRHPRRTRPCARYSWRQPRRGGDNRGAVTAGPSVTRADHRSRGFDRKCPFRRIWARVSAGNRVVIPI
ncbi:MAG: aminotransferase class III-fold pyridoxal phosphate-dependent enzyme [Rhodospirillales bacterium]|nr:aminotransferase class III-fold pyridoxal phosphate-dependent enzyme [Rhodospirillales bacterium]